MAAATPGSPFRGRTVFLPIITKVRELDSRLLLAAFLAQRGCTVVVGETARITKLARRARDGVYITPILVPAAADRLAMLRGRGHVLVGWDEEGLVYPDPRWYFGIRIGEASLSLLDVYMAWGAQPAADLRLALPDTDVAMLEVGNPRMDLLREPFRQVFEDEARSLRERYGPYLLVNTNFDLVNNADTGGAFLDRLRATGRIKTEEDEERFVAWGRFRTGVWQEFLLGIPRLREAFPGLRIVIRPHPSESLDCWRELERQLPGIVVTPAADSVIPWIMGAEAVLHNSCTTAVEAYVAGTPVIAWRPTVETDAAMESPLPNELSIGATSWEEVIGELGAVLAGNPSAAPPAAEQLLDRFVAGRTGTFASEQIADAIVDLASRPRRSRQSPVSSWAGRTKFVKRARNWWFYRTSTDARQRFPGFTFDEVHARLSRIGELFHVPITCRPVEENVILVEPVHTPAGPAAPATVGIGEVAG